MRGAGNFARLIDVWMRSVCRGKWCSCRTVGACARDFPQTSTFRVTTRRTFSRACGAFQTSRSQRHLAPCRGRFVALFGVRAWCRKVGGGLHLPPHRHAYAYSPSFLHVAQIAFTNSTLVGPRCSKLLPVHRAFARGPRHICDIQSSPHGHIRHKSMPRCLHMINHMESQAGSTNVTWRRHWGRWA